MDNRADEVNVEDGQDVHQMEDYRKDEEASSAESRHREFVLEGAAMVRFVHILLPSTALFGVLVYMGMFFPQRESRTVVTGRSAEAALVGKDSSGAG